MDPVDRAVRGDDLVSLADEEHAAEIIQSSVLGLWQVVNDLTRLRRSRRDQFRVTIFGSARIVREHWVYGAVHDLAAELARMGCVEDGRTALERGADGGDQLGDRDPLGAVAVGRRAGIGRRLLEPDAHRHDQLGDAHLARRRRNPPGRQPPAPPAAGSPASGMPWRLGG